MFPKKSILISLVIVIISGILIGLFLFNSRNAHPKIQEGQSNSESKIRTEIIKKIDWQSYRNTRLGFEIKHPKQVLATASWGCNMYSSESAPPEMVPVKFFEKGNIVYIAQEFFYDDACKKVINTFDLLGNSDQRNWKMIFKDINNKQELNQFVKEIYSWGKCRLGELEPTEQENVYDVRTYYDGKDLFESDCYINYMAAFKYYPKKEKAVAWAIGQEEAFWSGPGDGIGLDEEMEKSFRFIDN